MEFSIEKRKIQLYNFMKHFANEYNSKNSDGEFAYDNEMDMFKKVKLSSGVEGSVYYSHFLNDKNFKDPIAIKTVNLRSIQETKDIKKKIINMKPEKLYDLFLTYDAFKQPSLIELISQTLINQLVFQNICPNYTLNYYWEYTKSNNLNSYNEYVNAGTFDSWAKKNHSDLEWFNALFQIMVGLYAMKKYYNMLHTDFHTRNILVHKVKPGGYWLYKIDGKDYYLPNLGYIFLINDFGFGWVPEHIYMKWYYKDRLRYITKTGLNFYDISIFLKSILDDKKYKLPTFFKSNIKNMFAQEEVGYVITKNYYKMYYRTNDPKYIKYPNIKVDYTGLNTTLGDKIYQIFYNKNKMHDKVNFNFSKVLKNDIVLDTFSLDKKFDKEKLPRVYRDIVLN